MNVKVKFTGLLTSLDGEYYLAPGMSFIDLMKRILGHKYSFIFDESGRLQSFLALFHNNEWISNINSIHLSDGDQFVFMTAQSGG